jgi:hypothetical protein
MAVKPHGLANRPGEPYPATFRIQWTHRESNSDFRHARAVSSRWTMSPSSVVDRPGNRTPISWLQARHLPVGRAAQNRWRGMTKCQAPMTKLGTLLLVWSLRFGHWSFLSSGSGGRTRRAERMKLCWALAHPRHVVTKGRLELPCP